MIRRERLGRGRRRRGLRRSRALGYGLRRWEGVQDQDVSAYEAEAEARTACVEMDNADAILGRAA